MKKEKTLGETLKSLRTKAGVTQSDLGEKLSISAQAISKWERNESQPDIETLKKLAEIYNVTVAEIIDPDNAPIAIEPKNEEPTPVYEEKFDIYLSDIDKETNYLKTVAYIKNKFKLGVAESKKIADDPMHTLTGNVTAEEADMLTAYFAEIGVTVKRLPARGSVHYVPIITAEELEKAKREKESKAEYGKTYLRKRFILSNVTAILPAIAATVILLINKAILFDSALLCIYAGLSVYTTVFLLWYPSITRDIIGVILEVGVEDNGCLLFIPKMLLIGLFLVVTFLFSPIIYVFTLPKRIKRMTSGDMSDNIFE